MDRPETTLERETAQLQLRVDETSTWMCPADPAGAGAKATLRFVREFQHKRYTAATGGCWLLNRREPTVLRRVRDATRALTIASECHSSVKASAKAQMTAEERRSEAARGRWAVAFAAVSRMREFEAECRAAAARISAAAFANVLATSEATPQEQGTSVQQTEPTDASVDNRALTEPTSESEERDELNDPLSGLNSLLGERDRNNRGERDSPSPAEAQTNGKKARKAAARKARNNLCHKYSGKNKKKTGRPRNDFGPGPAAPNYGATPLRG